MINYHDLPYKEACKFRAILKYSIEFYIDFRRVRNEELLRLTTKLWKERYEAEFDYYWDDGNRGDVVTVFWDKTPLSRKNLARAAVYHDCDYILGGNKQDRLIADQTFRANIIKLYKNSYYGKIVAFTAYKIVRLFGGLNFNYF